MAVQVHVTVRITVSKPFPGVLTSANVPTTFGSKLSVKTGVPKTGSAGYSIMASAGELVTVGGSASLTVMVCRQVPCCRTRPSPPGARNLEHSAGRGSLRLRRSRRRWSLLLRGGQTRNFTQVANRNGLCADADGLQRACQLLSRYQVRGNRAPAILRHLRHEYHPYFHDDPIAAV